MNSCCKNMQRAQTVSVEPAPNGLFTVTTYCQICKCKWIFYDCKVTDHKFGETDPETGVTIVTTELQPVGKNNDGCRVGKCMLPDRHDGNHKIPASRAVPVSTSIVHHTDAKPPPLHGPDDEPGWDVDDNYPGVLSIDDDGEPLEITFDVDGVCSATKNVPDFSGSKFANCLKATDHDGDHYDPVNDEKWETS